MNAGRTTLSFLDLALMLLSAFAYAHFVNIADREKSTELPTEMAKPLAILGAYDYEIESFFGDSNALLTDFARDEIAKILSAQQEQLLTIYVPVVSGNDSGQRLRQWEKVAARSATIADAFEKAGQDGEMIVLKMPDKLVSQASEKNNIKLIFSSMEKATMKNDQVAE